MREAEMKLAVPPGFRLPKLDGLDGIRAKPAGTDRLVTTYWDTADLRLTRWRASLRHRPGEGWTVKLAPTVEGSLLVRGEHRFPGPRTHPPGRAVDLVRALIRDSTLNPMLRMRTARHRTELRDEEGRVVAEVMDDRVVVLEGRRVSGRFREVEVEVTDPGLDDLVNALRDRFAEAGAGGPDPTPKVVRALGSRALEPPEVHPVEPEDDATAADVVRYSVGASAARLIRHDAGVRLGLDPEDVHQARVATRRLRSDLRTFKPLLVTGWAAPLRDELRWLGGLLGEVRDRDVLLDMVRSPAESLPDGDRATAVRGIRVLVTERSHARERLLEALRGSRYVALLNRLVDAAREPLLLQEAEAPATEVLAPLARRRWRKVKRELSDLGPVPDDERLHRTRILIKRARYAAEAVSPVAGKSVHRFAKAAADVQDLLGAHQDAVVAETWLRDHASGRRAAFVAGRLAAVIRAEAEVHRSDLKSSLKKLRARGKKAWS
jgi:CHAD domain-containing protein